MNNNIIISILNKRKGFNVYNINKITFGIDLHHVSFNDGNNFTYIDESEIIKETINIRNNKLSSIGIQ